MLIDIAIIGGGPAGLTAALYASRAGWSVTLFEKLMPGGQMNTTPEIVNYPGLPYTEGFSLSAAMLEQLDTLNVERIIAEIVAISQENGTFILSAPGNQWTARTVVFAGGASRKKLGVPGEEKFIGRGVGYCAVCDGGFFKNKSVAIIGGGNTALEDALYMSKLCPTVHLIHRRNEFRGSRILQNQVLDNEKILLHLGYIPLEIVGQSNVENLVLQSVDKTQTLELEVSAVFIAVGSVADTKVISHLVDTDAQGRVVADESCKTSVPGLFVAGDVRAKSLYQIVTATADGANAVMTASQYLEKLL